MKLYMTSILLVILKLLSVSSFKLFDTEVTAHPLMAKEKILLAAKQSEKMGAMDFCIVISAKGPTPRIFKQVLEAVDLLREETNLKIGCSLGDLKEEQAYALKEHGVWRYNHNLEACKSFFPKRKLLLMKTFLLLYMLRVLNRVSYVF